jgi:hypothetical protein
MKKVLREIKNGTFHVPFLSHFIYFVRFYASIKINSPNVTSFLDGLYESTSE